MWLIRSFDTVSYCCKCLLEIILLFVEEYNYYQMGVLPSFFYSALTGKDSAAFKEILWKMSIMVTSVCIVSVLRL